MVMKTKGQLLLLLSLMTFSALNAAKPKIKTINYRSNVIYQGYSMSKKPNGEGKLYVIPFGSENLDNIDIIEGVFDDNKVEGSVTFNNGVLFKGTLQFEIISNDILYYLIEGSLQGNVKKRNEDYAGSTMIQRSYDLQAPITIRRSINNRKFDLNVDPQIIVITKTVDATELSEANSRAGLLLPFTLMQKFANNSEEIYITYDSKLDISNNTFIDFVDEGSLLEYGGINKIDIDFKNGYSGTYTYNNQINNETEELTIKSDNNNDYLFLRGESYNNRCYIKEAKVIRSIDNNVINYDWSEQKRRDRDIIIKKLQPEIRTRFNKCLSARVSVSNRRWDIEETQDLSIDFEDESSYYGTLYLSGQYEGTRLSSVDVLYLVQLKTIDPDDYHDGVLTTPQGYQTVYENGYSLEQLEEIQAKIDAAEEEKRVQSRQEEEQKKKEELEFLQPFYKKYGKENVDALYYQQKIQIGMPEGLLLDLLKNMKLWEEDTNYRVYRIYNDWGNNWMKTIWIDNKTKKIVEIINHD